MNKLVTALLLITSLVIISFSSFKTYELDKKKRVLKNDLIELSDIKYGMFNVDEWEKQLATIITKKINDLDLSGEDKAVAKRKIESFLHKTINNFEKSYKEENRKKALLGISFKNIGADVFDIFNRLEKNIPSITNGILSFFEKKENREGIRNYILAQLANYKKETFQEIDYTAYNETLSRYNCKDVLQCKEEIKTQIDEKKDKLKIYLLVIFILFLLVLSMLFLFKDTSTLHIIIYIFIALHLLVLGVFMPMIDIDARIGAMEFKLMKETISFHDQVLYYKSKSIIEMAKIMLTQSDVKVIGVGVLVLLFSIIFPLLKLSASLLVSIKREFSKNKIVDFLVFKSGKWSMADVMVVAIFMSYIGFSGIISSQLAQLENLSTSLEILTTNNSELQNGFYFFFGFVILSISLSQKIMSRFNSTNQQY